MGNSVSIAGQLFRSGEISVVLLLRMLVVSIEIVVDSVELSGASVVVKTKVLVEELKSSVTSIGVVVSVMAFDTPGTLSRIHL